MFRRSSASASPVSSDSCRSATANSGGSGFSLPTYAVGIVSVSSRSSLPLIEKAAGLLHGSRGDRSLQLPLEDGVDDEDRHDGNQDGREQPSEVDVVAGL